jgi:NADH dehydrogenase
MLTADLAAPDSSVHRIVVVGGGAAGLELATLLGDRLGRRGRAHVTLIDRNRSHFWKPHLHEIAAGSMNLGLHELSYMAQAHWHGFTDRIGEMTGLDRDRRTVQVAPHLDEHGQPVTLAREFPYDTLVIAVGSQTNDFGTPGVREHAVALETPADAERFHRRLVNACIRAHAQGTPLAPWQLKVAIIGAGATGVELAAELQRTTRELISYGLDRIDHAQHIGIHLVEAGPRVLPALPERLSAGALRQLQARQVTVHTCARVAAVDGQGVQLADGRRIDAELVVWAAGIRAPAFLAGLGLETNALNQLKVLPTLQTTQDENVFAIGDCAACPWLGREPDTVPPRAQAAHQQATHVADALVACRLLGRPLKPWRYRDFGSLISLGRYSSVGNLMGSLKGRTLWLDGYFGWVMYLSLYQMHQQALHGPARVVLNVLGHFFTRSTRPRVKLH